MLYSLLDKKCKRYNVKKIIPNTLYRNPQKSLKKVEKILNKPITKFCNSDDANDTAAKLWQTKRRPISLWTIDSFLVRGVHKV